MITIYFPIHPVCSFLTDKTKIHFANNVKRESNTYKIIDFVARAHSFVDEMEHLELRSHDCVRIDPIRLAKLRDLSTIMAIMISQIVLFFYKYDYVDQPDGTRDFDAVIP